MLTLRTATLEDARYVGARLRAGDAAEVLLLGLDGVEAIERSMRDSFASECIVIDGEPAAVLGLSMPDLASGVGVPWILTTDAVERHPIAFGRATRRILNRALDVAYRLENFTDARYTRALAWIEWLGFNIEPERDGLRHFWMEKN
jgi:hypothetical protein